jgi:hypothetical protein
MKIFLTFILLISTWVIFACSQSKPSNEALISAAPTAAVDANNTGKFTENGDAGSYSSRVQIENSQVLQAQIAKMDKAMDATTATKVASPSASPDEIKQPVDRKIIRNGDFTIESKNPSDDQRKIASIAESLGGFVVTSEFKQAASSDASGSSVNVIVRVPSAQFDKAINEIIKTGSQIIYQKTSGKDVTEEFVDLEARLRAKHALENQYLEIMKRASKISDVLEVQEKLTDVRTEIEQMEGRRRYLDNQASLSTINITLQSPAAIVAATQNGFWRSIKNSFGDGIDEAVGIVLGVIHFVIVAIPVFILVILPLWFGLRFLNRRYNFLKRWKKEIVPSLE